MSESIHVKMPHCWKSHDAAQLWCYSRFETYSLICLKKAHQSCTIYEPRHEISNNVAF